MGWQIIPGRTDRQQPGNSLLKKAPPRWPWPPHLIIFLLKPDRETAKFSPGTCVCPGDSSKWMEPHRMCHWWVSGTLWWNRLKWSLPIRGTPSMIQFKHSINALPSSASVGNMEKNHRFATAAYVLAWCQQILYSLQLSVSSTISCLFPKISIFLPTRLGFHNKIGPPFFRTLQI